MTDDQEEPRDVAEDALEKLVGQFSSKFDCFREMVQNSIDAGSHFIEIWTEFESDGRGAGTAIVHVDDDGEGMDRAIIDGQLTKLFSSKKEGDLTKIGKFGIGFVSIFALEPAAVLVHTGRGGEYWELLFHEDRSFQLKELDEPLEGTQLSLFLRTTEAGYSELQNEIRESLRHWCSHSETEITFEDRSSGDSSIEQINQPFEVQGLLPTRFEVPGTEIVAAYSLLPNYGFYNRGLALYSGNDSLSALGDRADRFGHISFKIKSRYLEHTLSRETVVKDEHYEKAIQMLEAVADGQMLESLINTTEELAKKDRSPEEERLLREYCALLVREPAESLRSLHERKILLVHHGQPLSPEAALDSIGYLSDAPRTIFACPESSSVTERAAAWVTTFVAEDSMGDSRRALLLKCLESVHKEREGGFLRRVFGKKRLPPHHIEDPDNAFFVIEEMSPGSVHRKLQALVLEYLRRLHVDDIELVWVGLSKESPPASPPELCVFRSDSVVELIEQGSSLEERKVAIVEAHSFIQRLLRLAESRADQAAFLLTQRLLLATLRDEPATLGLVEVLKPEALHG